MPHGVAKNAAQKPYSAVRRTFAALDPSQTPLSACFGFGGRFSLGDIMKEGIDVLAGHRGHLHVAKERLDVPFDPAPIDLKSAHSLRNFAPGEQAAC
jgi:hypothetical protein